MRTRRIFVPPEGITREGVAFPPKARHYLTRVLRLEPGQEVEVFDGRCTYRVRLIHCDGADLRGEIVESSPAAHRNLCEVTLAFGCVRPGPFEQILRHCTQLGVSCFVPVIARRTERRPDARKDRWHSVVASAAAQAGRADLPVIEAPADLDEFLERDVPGSKLVLSTHPGASPLLDQLERLPAPRLVLLVGPEGGFEPAEEDRARHQGFTPVSLGPFALRTETAAVVSVGAAAVWFAARAARS